MLARCILVAAALGGCSVLAAPAPSEPRHVVHEDRGSLLPDWKRADRIEGSAILPIRVGLTQNNLHRGDTLLDEVSNPESASYGKWYSAEDVHALFAPSAEAVAAVRLWITSSGIADSRIVHTDNKGWLAFDATAEEAERLLRAEFFEYVHATTDNIRVGADLYHIPEELADHIDFITPGVKLTPVVKRSVKRARKVRTRTPEQHKKRAKTSVAVLDETEDVASIFFKGGYPWKPPSTDHLAPELRNCAVNMTAPCIRALYGIPQSRGAVPGNSLGLYEQGDYFDEPDLDLYWKEFAPYVPQKTYPIPALIDGAQYSFPQNDTKFVQGEALIDIEMATALIYPQTVTLYQVDDQLYSIQDLATTNLFNTFLDALDGSYCTYSAYGETGNDPAIDPVYPNPDPAGYQGKLMCGAYKPAKVISASYGQAEADLPARYMKRQCNEFLKLGLQGTSMLTSSGDHGVASFPNDGSPSGCLGPTQQIFSPQYPSNCPYVTSVGGTMVMPNQTVLDPEQVMHVDLTNNPNFTSAGGFSNVYPAPAYQLAALAGYFARHAPPYPSYAELEPDLSKVKGLYNRIGRAYPDVAANGANFASFLHGRLVHFFGASLSSPLFASVLTLINEERARVGKGSVGFVNPTLYAFPYVLNDITLGTNLGCGSQGFPAVPGWDPSTGLGTPNYEKMRDLFLALP